METVGLPLPKRMYKIVNYDGEACNGGVGKWHLPVKDEATGEWTPGKWMPNAATVVSDRNVVTGEIRIVELVSCCVNGYHLSPSHAVLEWLTCGMATRPRVFLAEYDGVYDTTYRTNFALGIGTRGARLEKTAHATGRLMREVIGSLECIGFVADAIEFMKSRYWRPRYNPELGALIDEVVRLLRIEASGNGDKDTFDLLLQQRNRLQYVFGVTNLPYGGGSGLGRVVFKVLLSHTDGGYMLRKACEAIQNYPATEQDRLDAERDYGRYGSYTVRWLGERIGKWLDERYPEPSPMGGAPTHPPLTSTQA